MASQNPELKTQNSKLTLGFSPCPNDTFIFHALAHGLVSAGDFRFTERLEDVETLNRLARECVLDVSKVSYHALGFIRDDYVLLRSGGALGRGCGPLVVSRRFQDMGELKGKRIGVPGRYTTAALLLRLFDPALENIVYLPFHEIMAGVANGELDAGVIIHESRFTYPDYGLTKLLDLGDWWERESGHPIPLGCIVARRSMGNHAITALEQGVKESVQYAFDHPEAANSYIRAHSQEMSEAVCASHIGLYVNSFSLDLGSEGISAVEFLLHRGEELGVIPRSAACLTLP